MWTLAADPAAEAESLATDTTRKRRAEPQRIDCTRSSTPTNTQRKAFKTSGKGGRLRTLHVGLRGRTRHLEKPRCWVHPPHRLALRFVADSRVRLWAQNPSRGQAPTTESPPIRRAGRQVVDSTRSSTPTRRGKASKPAAKRGRIRTLNCIFGGHPRHLETPRCWIRSLRRPARLLVAGLWARAYRRTCVCPESPAAPRESLPIRRAEPQAVDSTRSSTSRRRGKASKPAAKGADSAP